MELFPKGFEKFPPPPVEDVEATKLYPNYFTFVDVLTLVYI